jgi:hypothetical protein
MNEREIIKSILESCSGTLEEYDDRYVIRHENGDVSKFWKRSMSASERFSLLGELYSVFNGINLFSSTFFIGRDANDGYADEFITTDEIAKESEIYGAVFPNGAIPFMIEPGMALYALDSKDKIIYRWDVVNKEITDGFECILDIFDEWLEVVGKKT